jgi:hypothetical protein
MKKKTTSKRFPDVMKKKKRKWQIPSTGVSTTAAVTLNSWRKYGLIPFGSFCVGHNVKSMFSTGGHSTEIET